jgi:hypothetical protein
MPNRPLDCGDLATLVADAGVAASRRQSRTREPRPRALAADPSDETANAARLRNEVDLELAGDQRAVAKHAAEQGLLELDRPEPRKPHGRRAPAQGAAHDVQLLRGDDDVCAIPPPHADEHHAGGNHDEGRTELG